MPPLKTYESHHSVHPLHTSSAGEQRQLANVNSSNNNNNNTNQLGATVNAATATDTKGKFFSNQYAQKVLMNLYLLRQNARFCDVEIVAGGRVFNAHRAILSASSAYFQAMFRPEFGLSEGKQKSVVLYSIDPNILQMLLDFIYTGRIEINQVGGKYVETIYNSANDGRFIAIEWFPSVEYEYILLYILHIIFHCMLNKSIECKALLFVDTNE